jgi:hypothetical protein
MLSEAKELARHSDIKMTMRYTHIGMEDQAKAIRNLPWHAPVPSLDSAGNPPPLPPESADAENGWEHSGSESGVTVCQDGALGDTAYDLAENDATPAHDSGCRRFSADDSAEKEWRRRELNLARNHREIKGLATKAAQNAAHAAHKTPL